MKRKTEATGDSLVESGELIKPCMANRTMKIVEQLTFQLLLWAESNNSLNINTSVHTYNNTKKSVLNMFDFVFYGKQMQRTGMYIIYAETPIIDVVPLFDNDHFVRRSILGRFFFGGGGGCIKSNQ